MSSMYPAIGTLVNITENLFVFIFFGVVINFAVPIVYIKKFLLGRKRIHQITSILIVILIIFLSFLMSFFALWGLGYNPNLISFVVISGVLSLVLILRRFLLTGYIIAKITEMYLVFLL